MCQLILRFDYKFSVKKYENKSARRDNDIEPNWKARIDYKRRLVYFEPRVRRNEKTGKH